MKVGNDEDPLRILSKEKGWIREQGPYPILGIFSPQPLTLRDLTKPPIMFVFALLPAKFEEDNTP
jgi:hypothetical protein